MISSARTVCLKNNVQNSEYKKIKCNFLHETLKNGSISQNLEKCYYSHDSSPPSNEFLLYYTFFNLIHFEST